MTKTKMRMRILLWMLIAVLATVLLCNSRIVGTTWNNLTAKSLPFDEKAAENWPEGTILKDIAYSTQSENQRLTLYLPKGDDLPVMILLYGGGVCMNDNASRQVMLMADYYRNHGYACAAVNYRLAREALAPAAIEDVKAAIRFLRYHASEYGLDADRMMISGESTGAYLGFMATLSGEDEFSSVPVQGVPEGEAVSSRVCAVVDFYGTMDMFHQEQDFVDTQIPAFIRNIAGSWFNQYLPAGVSTYQEAWLGKPLAEISAEDRRLYSPYRCMFEHPERVLDLAVWISHGGSDITVSPLQSDDLYLRLLDATAQPGNIHLEVYPAYKHSDDRLYAEAEMEKICAFLEERVLQDG